MRKSLLPILVLLFYCPVVFGQSLKGSIADSVDKKNLQYTVVSVLRPTDSVLVKFVRADKAGNFSINNIPPGKYILMITHPYVGDYFDLVEVKAGMDNEVGKIFMTPKSKLLAEVIVKSGSPIRIKGDTTVYTADSFKVRPGANVEELLRRLPGIQVDKNGQITAMGEKVKKVLVDGEEFFGSDPGIATKNLRADIVKEVEVFDKKSDQAEFTGIDDGVKDKTINLKLKDDKKKGYFGKIELGGGLKDKFNNSIMANAFKGKRKLAAYGIMSNTGQTNLDWQDAQNYGGGLEGMEGMESGMTEDGGMYISFGGGEDSYYGGRNGIPTNWNAGLHYNNKFNNGKNSVNAAYKLSKVNAPGTTTTFARNFWPDSVWNTNTVNDKFSSIVKHAFNVTVEAATDSANSLKWTAKVNNNTSRTTNRYFAESFTEDGDSINNSSRRSNNNSDNNNITSGLLWRHKFKKLSRTLSVNADLNWNESKNRGLLYSLNNYYVGGHRTDTIDQENIRNTESSSIVTKIAYTEPLRKDVYLELNYSFAYYTNRSERITMDGDGSGKYEDIIDSLSNSFLFNRIVNTPGASIRVNKKKYNYSFGASVGFSHFEQNNLTEVKQYDYDFTNFFPRATFQYKFKPNESIRFNYNGNTTAPSLEQLQPIRVNSDPFNIYIGNPDLDQSFRHSFNLSYNFYNVLKDRNLFTNFNYSLTQNAFTQFNSVDANGIRTYQTVNVNGIYNMNLYSSYGFKIPDTKWHFGVGPSLNANRNIDFVRDPKTGATVKNITNTTGYGVNINVNQYVEDKYNFYFGPNFTWNRSSASVNTSANASYWQLTGWFNGTVQLPKKFEISSDANIQYRQKDPRFPANNNYTTWNASVRKRFLKGNDLELELKVFDILNENRGYQRNFNSYSFTETYNNTLRRFWQLTFIYNFSKNGKPTTGF